MSAFIQDLRFALRLLRKSPGFALMATVIMALGIGANTAIFSVVHAVLLEPLPFHHVDGLVQVWHTPPQTSFPGMTRFAVSAANFFDWQRQNHVFEQIALYSGAQFDVTGAGKPEAVSASTVSPEFFPVLGVQPLHGRVFLPEESSPGKNREVILGYKFWQTHYGSDAGVVGRSINLDGDPYTVVGVMGPAMTKPSFAQIWVPLALTPAEVAVRGEIGLRIAFGATKVDVLRVVVAQGMKPTVLGIFLGLFAAFALGRVVTSMVYGVSSRDMLTFVAVTVLLLLVSFVASLSPAVRATRISPLAVIRDE